MTWILALILMATGQTVFEIQGYPDEAACRIDQVIESKKIVDPDKYRYICIKTPCRVLSTGENTCSM